MRNPVSALVALCCAAASQAVAQPIRWEIADGGNGHYYEFVSASLAWPDAEIAAGLRVPPAGYAAGHLLTVSDDAEDAFVWTTFGATGWIGFTDEAIEGEWRWIDATPGIWQDPDNFPSPIQTAYVLWVGAEPNNQGDEDYAVFGWFTDSWIDGRGSMAYYVEYEPAGPACGNGIDDDRDELGDFPADPGCDDADDDSERGPAHACDDGADDDGDGAADFPADPGCASASDDSERDAALVCDDGSDNDGDGLADHPADPDCTSPGDDSEEHVPACENGLDDDGDLHADAPSDPGCANAADDSELESTLPCDNGVDDDGDGFVDHPADPGCSHPSDDGEANVPACSNGSDDDADLLVDYPADPQCTSAADLSETTAVRWERNGHYYELSANALTWTNALVAAAQPVPPAGYQPGHLLSLSDADESAFVVASFGPSGGWIGFTDRLVEGEWRWIDATPGIWQDPDQFASPIQTAYVNWVRGEPNDFGGGEDFTEFPVNVLERWNDGGNVARRFYIEWEPIPGPACDNGADDDGDGAADFPADPGCTSASDASETEPGLVCDNALDDDGDGRADHPADPGCTSSSDDSERDPTLVCDDDLDEDSDGFADYPADPGCASPSDDSERNPVIDCDDGLDDDGDGLADFPADPGCPSPAAEPEDPDCDDDLDNDGDGRVDFDDPECTSSWPYWESAPCGLGAEIALALASIAWLRRRRAR